MSGPFLLLVHSLKRIRTLVLTISLVLAAFQLVMVAVAGSIYRSNGFQQFTALLPQFAKELMGPAFMSYAGIVCLGYFHLVVMSSLVGLAIAIGTMPASEVDTGFIDLILSRPLARHWIITRTIAAVILSAILVLVAMMLGTWTGLATLAPKNAVWPTVTLIRSLALNLGLLILCWSGIALAIGSATRRGFAGGCTAVLALTSFLLDYVGRLWTPAATLGKLSPFRYYTPFDMVVGAGLPLKNVLVLGSIAAVGYATAYLLFSRRDLSH